MRIIFTLSFLICLSYTAIFAQKNKAFILRFEHQCSDPVSYPNYFENTAWSDKLIDLVSDWLKANFEVETVDYKRKGTISYVPVVDYFVNLRERSLRFTAYDLSLTIESQLETKENYKKLRENEALLSFEVKIWNKQERNVFRHRSKSRMVIIPNNQAVSQAKISAEDFQKFYEEGLRTALKQQKKSRIFSFKQPQNITLEAFIKNADFGNIARIDRINYELALGQYTKLRTKNKLQNQYKEKDSYMRSCEVYNPVTEKNYTLKALLKAGFPNAVALTLYDKEKAVGRLQFIDTPNQTLMSGKVCGRKIDFEINKKTSLKLLKIDEKLKGIIEETKTTKNYKAFLDKTLSQDDKSILFHVLTAQSLGEAVRKFYRIENKN